MARTPSTMLPLGTPAPDFTLPDTEGNTVSRTDFANQPLLVMFICNHCPFVVHLRAALADFGREYTPRGLAIVAINSNDPTTHPQDGPDHMRTECTRAGYVFPYLFDATQDVAHAYHAACTPDFFLFAADHTLAYRGQFDGSRPGSSTPITGADLRAAADAVLTGTAVPSDQLPSMGCNIKWRRGNEPKHSG